ncbi:hypothetical protein Tco_1045812 [Tanacetum coccineum]|uniref:Uncharacterized protein n=1 Tax=Tanacetum coccineum TaxID=301880 RepID=A0ABQ5GW15_9ASTR
MVKNLKLNVNTTSSVSSACSYPKEDPQSSYHPFNSVNAIKTCFKSTNDFQIDQPQVKTLTVNKLETPKSKELEGALEDEFKDLHLKLPVLKVLAHDLMYNAILDKYVESLKLGKNGSAFIQGKMPKKMKDPGLFTLPCRLWDSKAFDTLADLGSYVNLIPLYLFKTLNVGILEETENVLGLADGTKLGILATASAIIDCKKIKIAVGEGVTRLIFGVKEIDLGALPHYYLEKDFMNDHLPRELEIARDAKLNPFKDVIVFRKMVEFLGVVPINLKGDMWESDDLIEKKID